MVRTVFDCARNELVLHVANKNICFSNESSLRQVAHMKDWSDTERVLFFVLKIPYKAVVGGCQCMLQCVK